MIVFVMSNYQVAKYAKLCLLVYFGNKFYYELRQFFWEDLFLHKKEVGDIVRICIHEHEQQDIISTCHFSAYGGYHACMRTRAMILQSGFIGPL
jgi:hypothetical protein